MSRRRKSRKSMMKAKMNAADAVGFQPFGDAVGLSASCWTTDL